MEAPAVLTRPTRTAPRTPRSSAERNVTSGVKSPRIEATNNFDRQVWADLLQADPTSLASQSPAWVDAICRGGPYKDVSRLYTVDGREFVLPLVARRGPGGRLFAASLPIACENGGLVGPDLSADVVSAVATDLRGSEFLSVHVHPNALQAPLWAEASDLATEVIARTSHIVDLAPGADEVRSGFGRTARRNVGRAERLDGLEILVGQSGDLLDDFYDMLRLSRTRWAENYRSPKVLMHALGERHDPKRKFSAIADELGDNCAFALAYIDGQPAAGVMATFGRDAYYTRGAMDRSLVTGVNPNPLLHWRMMQLAMERGCQRYHLGESGQSQGLAHFKASLGGVYQDNAEYRFEKLPFTNLDRRGRSLVKRVIGFRDDPSPATR